MKHCAACGRSVRNLRIAIVLRGPKSARPGKVCDECADLGWLFVVGDDSPRNTSNGKTKARGAETKAPKGETMTVKWGLGLKDIPRIIDRVTKHATSRAASAPASDALPPGERRILIAVAQTPGGVERRQLTILVGFKRSTRDTYIQKLHARGFLEVADGKLWPTVEGIAALGDDFERLPTGRALLAHWLGKLPPGERKILDHLTHRGVNVIVQRDALSDLCGFKRSTRDTYIQRLTARRLVATAGARGVQASAELFDQGAP